MWIAIWSILALSEPLKVTKSTVSFLAVGRPAMIKIRGTGDCLAGEFKVSGKELLISAECDLRKISTGIDLRDTHMRDKYLEVKDFPKAFFTGSTAFKEGKSPLQGKLKVHGVEVPINGEVTGEKDKWTFEFKTKVTDHKISVPEYLKIKVAEDILVTVEIFGTIN